MKFIKGVFEFDHNIDNLEEYESDKVDKIQQILDWGDNLGAAISFYACGTSNDRDYLCEYKIIGNTAQYCKGIKSELKDMLKEIWKKPIVTFEGSGNCFDV